MKNKSIKTSLIFALSLICLSVHSQISYKVYDYTIDFTEPGIQYKNYWNATGFTPGELLFRDDMQLTLDYLSTTPNKGILYVRPHWMLNLVGSRYAGTSQATYNFETLGDALEVLTSRGLKPIFEVMGFPYKVWEPDAGRYDDAAQSQQNHAGQWIPDFEREEDILLWYDFIKQMVIYLEKRFGADELKSWFFECTNEPDIHQHFWDLGIPALLNYWDATSEAIKAVNNNYIFGGPGTALGVSDEFKAVLAHCDTGTNAITGRQGSVIDYISVHRKFLPYEMVDRELECINYIREHHPRFTDLPFWNDEADPMAGWSRSYWWRPHPWYGAFVVQSVDAHNRLLIDSANVSYQMLLNDNGFMGNWYQRTQLARFINHDGPDRELNFWLFKKPVLTVMSMLSLSEGIRYQVEGYNSTREDVIVIPSITKNGDVILMVANKPEFGPVHNEWENNPYINSEQKVLHDPNGAIVNLNLHGLGFEQPRMRHFRLDALHGYAHGAWKSLGSPDTITSNIYKLIAAHMEPVLMENRKTENADEVKLTLPPSSISMIVISEDNQENESNAKFPDILHINKYRGYNGEVKNFIRWEQVQNSLVMYNVYASYDGSGFTRINPSPLLNNGYLDVWPEGTNTAEYRIIVSWE